MSVLLGVIAVFAVLSWIVAVIQAVAIMRLASREGHSWGDFLIGWWKFDAIRAKAGPDSESYLSIYKRAIAAFIFFLLLGLVLSGWMTSQRSQPASTAETGMINDPRVIPATLALNPDNRRAATVPGALILES